MGLHRPIHSRPTTRLCQSRRAASAACGHASSLLAASSNPAHNPPALRTQECAPPWTDSPAKCTPLCRQTSNHIEATRTSSHTTQLPGHTRTSHQACLELSVSMCPHHTQQLVCASLHFIAPTLEVLPQIGHSVLPLPLAHLRSPSKGLAQDRQCKAGTQQRLHASVSKSYCKHCEEKQPASRTAQPYATSITPQSAEYRRLIRSLSLQPHPI